VVNLGRRIVKDKRGVRCEMKGVERKERDREVES
jgi:hypothetical protein